MAKVTTFSIDPKTEETLTQIRQSLGATSNAEVLRRAINLLGVATKVVNDNGKIILQDDQGRSKEILLG
jgi:hypothetical protein